MSFTRYVMNTANDYPRGNPLIQKSYLKLIPAVLIVLLSSLACFPGMDIDFLSDLLPGRNRDGSTTSGTIDWVIEDCFCSGLEAPINQDRSRASRLSGGLEIPTVDGERVQLEPSAQLACVQEQEVDLADLGLSEYFESDARGWIRYQTRIYRFPDPEQAARYIQVQESFLAENPVFCEEDPYCTVTALDFSEDHFLYITETEEAFNSQRHYQSGVLLGLHRIGEDVLAAEIRVYHPAVNPGDSWARDALVRLANCHGLSNLRGDW